MHERKNQPHKKPRDSPFLETPPRCETIQNQKILFVDFINNAIGSLSDAIALLARKFETSSWMFSKELPTFEQTLYISMGNGAKVFGNGFLERQIIICHAASKRPAVFLMTQGGLGLSFHQGVQIFTIFA